jgi:uncharacterized SAM-binding protein YcdF (DUF218 family)
MFRTILAGLLAIFVAAGAFFAWGPDFLCVDDGPPRIPADLVVALAGPASEDGRRVAAGVELVRGEKARILLLPLRHRALEWPWFVRHYRIREPIGDDRVIVGRVQDPGERAASGVGGTFSEAVRTVEVMRRHRYRTAVIVSSCYHMRRARLAFERARQGDAQLSFHYYPVADENAGGPEAWWLREGYFLRVADEYIKLIGGYIFYR